MSNFVRGVPEGDDRERLICPDCGHVAYENPKIVVGAVVASDDRILLCRRAIEPRHGFWTLPAGYLELGETVEEGARREVWEEARAEIVIEGILAIYTISRIGQVQILFRSRLCSGVDQDCARYAPGPESLEVSLFAWNEIPWHYLAFPTVGWALRTWREGKERELNQPAGNPPEDPRGVRRIESQAPNAPSR